MSLSPKSQPTDPTIDPAVGHLMAKYRCVKCENITIVPRPRRPPSDVPKMTMVPPAPSSRAKKHPQNTIPAYCMTCMEKYHLPVEIVRDLDYVEFDNGEEYFEYLDQEMWHRPCDITELKYTFTTGDCFTSSVPW